MVGSRELADVLIAAGARSGCVTHTRVLPARPGRTAAWPSWADRDLVAGYRTLGVDEPWVHQVQAADAAHAGHHTVLATSAGSGKSLAFWLPALTDARAQHATTLYLAPTKALAADQLAGLHRLVTAAGVRDVHLAVCDGDTSYAERRWVRDHGDVVATNPDFLHFSLLPGHRRWVHLLARLRYVVVDECHAFRGVFGAHVALVLRRLRRVAASYGATPVFVCASATTADPQLSAARLLGVDPADVVVVTADTSPAGPRTIMCWQPPLLPTTGLAPTEGADPPADGARRSVTAETAELLADLVVAGGRVLAFTRSRRGAETVATTTQARLAEKAPHLADRVRAYRGGYLPEERRALEAAVRDGSIRALATTNALELGVDITGLDAVVVAGFPGTRVSWWQQAGRAGRAGAPGLVVLVAREDPLDTYLVHHPHALLDAPVEPVVLDPDNPAVLAPHLAAAAAELPLSAAELAQDSGDGSYVLPGQPDSGAGEPDPRPPRPTDTSQGLFGPAARGVLDDLTAHGVLRQRGRTWYWTHPRPASGLTDLRGGGPPVQVVNRTTGEVLGTVDTASADSTCHPGAVYVHQGATFVVDDLVHDEGVALVDAQVVDWRTWARWSTTVAVVTVEDQTQWGPVTWAHGLVDVTTQVTSFTRRRLGDCAVLSSHELDMPERALRTAAVWWTAPPPVLAAAGVTAETAPGALHAAEHASIGLLPLLATCDRGDLGGLSTLAHPDTGEPTVFVHESFPGGAGFTRRGFELGPAWLRATRDAIASCPCPAGCPSCVQSPKCGNANEPLAKDASVRL
ncbi:MAG: DEAD/DEAH box helicase, partial [Micrococcales bacterium]|nr:DEAD/DEAH box helicase [Micrococcales bacterium]